MSDYTEHEQSVLESEADLIIDLEEDRPKEGPLSSLDYQQRARVAALNLAAPVLTNKGLLGSGTAPDVSDLLRLSEWILSGNQEPLYPYTTADMVVLGPDLSVNLEGHRIYWHGIRFNREDDNA
jgi:hypothetical protein